ncbi:MAG: hypothetical protein EBS01_03800 [Verrucomicrobia bacterium]|nr:hypothetical protein [Verrucomicrobiota bacterium]
MAAHQVRCLLMGGQACVFYGAAEFSRDSDFAILSDAENLDRLRGALTELRAGVIAVPPFDAAYLEKGHAIHFRCRHPECDGLRVDVMSVMRGVDPFESIWQRRATIELPDGTLCELLSIADLVRAKKTQRDKDWPMIRRLLEADYFSNREQPPDPARVLFWLRELRTPELLISVCKEFRELAFGEQKQRPLLEMALNGKSDAVEEALFLEEFEERRRDREYWTPLKRELEELRRQLVIAKAE